MKGVRERYIKNEYIEMWIEDGVLFGRYFERAIIDIDSAIKVFEDREKISEGKSYPILADGRGVKYWTKAARDFQNGEKNCRLMKAGAGIIPGPIIGIIANFYLKIQKPIIPTRFFTSVEDGLKWLEQFKDKT
ncbi:MAG TPA: hypothetical protein VD908_02080 [Cytophagales bacterium]|nr:hypothetical protein [Cytophagales bacterium]